MSKEELEKESEEKFKVSNKDEDREHFYDRMWFKIGYLAGAEPREKRIEELEQQIEKMKSQYDYAFNQLCKSREMLCSMLSQYRDRKEIDYSTRECGEKLLKEGVYKND